MKQADMSAGDFQKLLQIALMDLRIRRTLLENEINELQDEIRTLEQEDQIGQLETQIMTIQKDYEHYKAYLSEAVATDDLY